MSDRASVAGVPLILAQSPGESPTEHRAFLLYGMSIPGSRGRVRRVGRAVGKNESTVRHWCKAHSWDARTTGVEMDRKCADAYHLLYNETHGDVEVLHMLQIMRVPYTSPAGSRAVPLENAAAAMAEATAGGGGRNHRKEYTERVDRILQLTDATIGAYAKKLMSKGGVDVRPGDLLVLAKTAHMLSTPETDSNVVQKGQKVVVDTIRVRQARANGEPILPAALEDAEELVVLLRHLCSTPEAALGLVEVDAPEDQFEAG